MTYRKYGLSYPWNFIEDVLLQPINPQIDPEEVENGFIHLMMMVVPERSRNMIKLKYRAGFTHAMIARQFGISSHTVGLIIQKEMRRLRHPRYSIFLLEGYTAGIEWEKAEWERQNALHEARRIPDTTSDSIEGDILDIDDPYERIDAIFERGGDDEIWYLDIDTRTTGVLNRNGIEYVWQLCFCTEESLLCLRDVGTRTFERIEEALNKWNLALDDGLIEDVEGWDEYVQYAVNKMSGQPCNNQ